MEVSKIYEGLKAQADILAGIEQRLTEMIAINASNLKVITPARSITDLPIYFANQHQVFNALLQVAGDMKVINSYTLLEVECQLRGDEPTEPYDEGDESDFRKV